jgi:hypothetical protein
LSLVRGDRLSTTIVVSENMDRVTRFDKVLVANRGEIAIRIPRGPTLAYLDTDGIIEIAPSMVDGDTQLQRRHDARA